VLNLVGNETGIVVNAAFIAADHKVLPGKLEKCIVVLGMHFCDLPSPHPPVFRRSTVALCARLAKSEHVRPALDA
jgi:hypothetical protein